MAPDILKPRLQVGVSAVFDPEVTPHARTFLHAIATSRNQLAALDQVCWHWCDDGADPARGAQVARYMIDRQVDLVIGHFSSDAALAAAPLYRAADIALITPAATVDRLTDYDNVLRLCPSDRQIAADLTTWVYRQGWRRVYVSADDSAHGQALAAAIVRAMPGCALTRSDDPGHADVEVFAGRLRPSREHWQSRRRAGQRWPLVLTDDAASAHLGAAQLDDKQTWVIGFDTDPGAGPTQTYLQESLRLLRLVASLAPEPWPSRKALLQKLQEGLLATFDEPLLFERGEYLGSATRLWRVGQRGLEPPPT